MPQGRRIGGPAGAARPWPKLKTLPQPFTGRKPC